MKAVGGGFGQCYNGQAVVVAGNMLVVATDVVQASHAEQQIEAMLSARAALPGIRASRRRCWPMMAPSAPPAPGRKPRSGRLPGVTCAP